jgi:hypothetical protein
LAEAQAGAGQTLQAIATYDGFIDFVENQMKIKVPKSEFYCLEAAGDLLSLAL